MQSLGDWILTLLESLWISTILFGRRASRGSVFKNLIKRFMNWAGPCRTDWRQIEHQKVCAMA